MSETISDIILALPRTTLLPSSALAVVVAWLIIRQLARRPRKLDMPHLELPGGGDGNPQQYAIGLGSLLEQGYEKYSRRGLSYSILNPTDPSRPIAVLPVKYLSEVRSAPESKLSFPVYLNTSTFAKYIGAPEVTERVIHVVRHDLNKSMNDLIEPLQQACDALIPGIVPPTEDWTPTNGFSFLLPLVSRLMARVLLGPELWNNDEWHTIIMTYFQVAFAASARMRDSYRPSMRWSAKYFDSDVKAVYKTRQQGQRILKSTVEARLADVRNGQKGKAAVHQDALQWLVESYVGDGQSVNADKILQDQAFLVAASVHSIALTALSILLDLVERTDDLVDIRKEISLVHAEHGAWTRRSLGLLTLLDSFMKESQRFHNFQCNTMQRTAVTGFTFKDGLHIPAGTPIVVPSRSLGLDPNVVDGAEKFDARRWQRKREQGDSTKFHFASVQDDMLPWGSGLHACPGRFLAQDMIKLIFIRLVTSYEMKYPEGVEGRPADLPDRGNFNPNVMAMILFKER